MCIYKIYYKEVAHGIVESDESPDVQLPSPRAPGELMVQLQFECWQARDPDSRGFSLSPKAGMNPCPSSQAVCRKCSLFARGVLLGPSTDWMGPTHIREGNLNYSSLPI